MSTLHPDRWVLVQVPDNGENGGPFYKIVGGWSGGYLDSDSWRMNSGISHVVIEDEGEDCDKEFYIHGFSGSIYHCWDFNYGVSLAMAGIIGQLLKKGFLVYDEDNAMKVLYELRKEV